MVVEETRDMIDVIVWSIIIVVLIMPIFVGIIKVYKNIHLPKTIVIETTETIYAGNFDGDLLDFAVKYHGEGNAHYSDSLGYWYFLRDDKKMRLINGGVLKRWEER